jgi:hypothetical protein
MFPYRVGEVPLKHIGPLKSEIKFSSLHVVNPSIRKPILCSVGCHLDGAALPHCDVTCSVSLFVGCQARFSHQCPVIDETLWPQFEAFVKSTLETEFVPLSPAFEFNPEEWIKRRPYTDSEKKEKLAEWYKAQECFSNEKLYDFKMFMKEESYPAFKHGRAINGPSDAAKVYFGTLLEPMESDLFSRPSFIKKIAVCDRPAYIKRMFNVEGGHFVTTDYSYFEASFTKRHKEAVEIAWIEHMYKNHPRKEEFVRNFRRSCTDQYKTSNKHFSVKGESVRMSGESITSSGNGLMNWLAARFMAKLLGNKNFLGVFEGDDGLTWYSCRPPQASDYARLGFDIKLELHDTLETTSFCGQVFDIDEQVVVTDPAYVLAGLGWIPSKYVNARKSLHLGLLRAKAWSYGYQYQATPIISAMARAYLRLTRGYDARKALEHLDLYKREMLLAAFKQGRPELCRPVGMGTRLLVEKLYGVSIDIQLRYEAYFDSLEVIEPIPLFLTVPQEWTDYSLRFVRDVSSACDVPCEVWPPAFPVNVQVVPVLRDPRYSGYISERLKHIR